MATSITAGEPLHKYAVMALNDGGIPVGSTVKTFEDPQNAAAYASSLLDKHEQVQFFEAYSVRANVVRQEETWRARKGV